MADNFAIDESVQYASPGGISLKGDLYRPLEKTGFPILVAVHGGAWRTGSPKRYRHWGTWLASRGVGLFAIEYRLANPGAPTYPAAAQDVLAAVSFLQGHAGEFGLDPNRIGLLGDSAGAHLASLVVLAGSHGRFQPDVGPVVGGAPVLAVIGVYGVYDLLAQWEHDQLARPHDQVTELFLGISPLVDKLRYHEASPLSFTIEQAAKPSFLIVWGTEDDVVDWRKQSDRFVTALKQAGYFVRTVPVAGAPHFWMDEPIEAHSFTQFLAPRLLRFVKGHL